MTHILTARSLPILVLIFFLARTTQAAIYTTTISGGSWPAGSAWLGGVAPVNGGSHTANILGDVSVPSLIQGFTAITLAGSKSFTSATDLTLQDITLFTVTNGNMVVNGNLTLDNTALVISLGNLTVTGTLTLTGGASLTFDSGGSISTGAFTNSGAGGTLSVNAGSFAVTNSISLDVNGVLNTAVGSTTTAAGLSISNNSSAQLNNAGTITINGNTSQGGTFNNNGTLNLNGNMTSTGSGSSVLTNNGALTITGDVSVPSAGKFYTNPGAQTVVEGSVTVGSNENLVVGTSVAPPPYADMIVHQDIISSNSGDVRVKQNGRLGVLGNILDSNGGGTFFTIDDGGQVYVEGDIIFDNGGGNGIVNDNLIDPFGLYVKGDVTVTGGGSSSTGNLGDEEEMYDSNQPFFDWVSTFTTPLPVTLLYLRVINTSAREINLVWATASESDFDKFIIERSGDGKNFTTLGAVNGARINTLTRHNYSFTDKTPLPGRSYYRLKIVDIDGGYEYSHMAILESKPDFASALRLYPNPVLNGHFTLELNESVAVPALLRVADHIGSEIFTQSVKSAREVIKLPPTLKPGIYLAQVNSGLSRHLIRIIVE